jgi:hypothetical protein
MTDHDSRNTVSYSIVRYCKTKIQMFNHWHVNIGIRHDGPGQAAARQEWEAYSVLESDKAAHVNIIANALIARVFTVT